MMRRRKVVRRYAVRPMEKVLGIGGLFFRARDSKALAQWYQTHLGVKLTPSDYETAPWFQAGGPAVFAPFRQDSKLFPIEQVWMVNFRVSRSRCDGEAIDQRRHQGRCRSSAVSGWALRTLVRSGEESDRAVAAQWTLLGASCVIPGRRDVASLDLLFLKSDEWSDRGGSDRGNHGRQERRDAEHSQRTKIGADIPRTDFIEKSLEQPRTRQAHPQVPRRGRPRLIAALGRR